MKKKICLIFITSLISLGINAQTVFYSYSPFENGFTGTINSFIAESSKTKSITLSVYNTNRIRRISIDSNNIKTKEILQSIDSGEYNRFEFPIRGKLSKTADFIYQNHNYIRGLRNGSDLLESFYDIKERRLVFVETNLKTIENNVTDFLVFDDKERLITTLLRNNQIWFICNIEDEDSLIIYKKEFSVATIKEKIEVKLNSQFKKSANGPFELTKTLRFSDLFKKSMLVVLDENQYYPIAFAGAESKLFVRNDELFFVINTYNTIAYSIRFNLHDYTIKTALYSDSAIKVSNNSIIKIQSYLLNDYFISVRVNGLESLKVSFFSVESGLLLKSLIIKQEDINKFASKPLTKKGNFTMKDAKKEVQIKKLIVMVPNISIMPILDNETIYLNIGGLYNRETIGELFSGLAIGAVGLYATRTSFLLLPPQDVNQVDISFQLPIDKNSLTPVNARILTEKISAIKEYELSHKHAFKKQSLIYFNNAYYLGAFTEDKKRYVIQEF